MPYSNAEANNVRKTYDLTQHYTDYYMLPLANNAQMGQENAIASGSIIFDEGTDLLTNGNYTKVQMYMLKDAAANTFQMKLTVDVANYTASPDTRKDIVIGDLKIMWASKSGLDKMTKATVSYTQGADQQATVSLNTTTDILTVTMPND